MLSLTSPRASRRNMVNHPIAYPLSCEPFRVVLTARQFRLYCYILEQYVATGRVILRSLARADGLSINGAVCHVNALERKGWIRRDKRLVGAIVPLYRLELFRDSVPEFRSRRLTGRYLRVRIRSVGNGSV